MNWMAWFAGTVLFVAMASMQANGKSLYVSVSGNDEGAGTKRDPLATLTKARDRLRSLRKEDALGQGPVKVVVEEGTYTLKQSFQLEKKDGGRTEGRVLFTAQKGKEVRLTGGKKVPPDAFVPVKDEKVIERLALEARKNVLQVDLSSLVDDSLLGEFPVRFRGVPSVPELFFNDQRMRLCRWPNKGWTTIAKILDSGSNPRQGEQSNKPGSFQYEGNRPERWNVEEGVWLQGYWCFDWYEETIRVQSIDTENKAIVLAEPHLYSIRQGNPSPRRFKALNLLEELDEPGEYFLDRKRRLLYFWPPAPLENARIVLSCLNAPVVSLENASNVTLRGFIVENGLGDGIVVRDGEKDRVEACHVRNLRQVGIRVDGGKEHVVEACDIHDTGTGGLHLSGGDRTSLTPGGHEALNNHIWEFSKLQLTYANGILLAGVGHRAAHNLIHDAPHQAVCLAGNDHVFEYNEVHHVCMETDDCGALYKGRNPSCRGNVIRYNWWHHIGSPMGHGNAAVYFDDGDGGETVFGNLFYQCGDPGKGSFGTVFSHGGHDNLAENNVFIECKRPLGSAPWNDKRWKEMIEGDLWQTRLLEEVDITSEVFLERYPALKGFMNPQPGERRVNVAKNNVFVRCEKKPSGNWQVEPSLHWSTSEDPGFVDFEERDLRLKENADVFQRLPEFEPIPWEKIGLYCDKLRKRK